MQSSEKLTFYEALNEMVVIREIDGFYFIITRKITLFILSIWSNLM